VPTVSVAADPNAAVNDLADRFWEGILERDPMWATLLGDERYNDRWPDLGEAGRAADEAAFRETLDEASRIPAESLAPEVDSATTVCVPSGVVFITADRVTDWPSA